MVLRSRPGRMRVGCRDRAAYWGLAYRRGLVRLRLVAVNIVGFLGLDVVLLRTLLEVEAGLQPVGLALVPDALFEASPRVPGTFRFRR